MGRGDTQDELNCLLWNILTLIPYTSQPFKMLASRNPAIVHTTTTEFCCSGVYSHTITPNEQHMYNKT